MAKKDKVHVNLILLCKASTIIVTYRVSPDLAKVVNRAQAVYSEPNIVLKVV